MKTPPSTALPLLVALAAGLVAAPALAEDIAAAEALFDKGLADMKAGKYETGCKAIAESQRLDPRPGTLFTLATCESEWGHVATAATRFGDYLALYETLPPDKKANQGERPKVARETRDKLLPEVPRLTISLPKDAPAGTTVTRDGEVIAGAALGVALPVDPGEYLLITRTPTGAVREQRITVSKGENKQVVLEIAVAAGPVATGAPTAAPTATAPIAPNAGPSGLRVGAYVVGAAGALGLIAGGVLGGLTAAQKDTIEKHCGAGIGSKDDTACDPTGLDAANNAKGLGLGSTIALAAGGAALAVGVVLFIVEPKGAKASSGTSGGQGTSPREARSGKAPDDPRGVWISAGVLSAGPGGARFGVEGAW